MSREYILRVVVMGDDGQRPEMALARFGRPEGSRPRTGEKRKVLQPFRIDALPLSWRGRIIELRGSSWTWEQIEKETAAWEWGELNDKQRALFAGRRIPMSTLHRWFDVRVLQPLAEIAGGSPSTDFIAAKVFGHDFEHLDDGAKNALADIVLRNGKNAGGIASVIDLGAAL